MSLQDAETAAKETMRTKLDLQSDTTLVKFAVSRMRTNVSNDIRNFTAALREATPGLARFVDAVPVADTVGGLVRKLLIEIGGLADAISSLQTQIDLFLAACEKITESLSEGASIKDEEA